ncbi:MAG TPA: thiamine pyrophosphate-dependent dehydrogenase E1 component subunit alpha [Acidimicrobiia bacterium]|nr:thiamine pyrophosphate-dependent dehydrogenase E1 component subunit alpha [Acidimicrobiia bacterium]
MSANERVGWMRKMLEIRLFEDKVQELFMQGQIQGTTHLCQGQEAVSVGAVGALDERDYLTITYRGHGHALAHGMTMEAAFGELMGRTSGCCTGVGGSMHLTDFSRNLIGAFAIIGPSYSVGLGAAMSAKLRGTDAVAMSFCGDGSTNIGTFHEALNMASVWRAPIVFVIENNLYGEYSPLRETTAVEDLAERAKAHAMPGVIVDGQDVDAVRETTETAIARARAGEGPTLIEAKTYRYRGHSRTDPAKYRPEGELERWKERDPIDLFAAKLVAEGALGEGDLAAMRAQIQTEVDAAAERAAEAPVLSLEETKAYVYAS